jgi:hypothetical protein
MSTFSISSLPSAARARSFSFDVAPSRSLPTTRQPRFRPPRIDPMGNFGAPTHPMDATSTTYRDKEESRLRNDSVSPDERRGIVGRTRVFGALGFIIAAVIAETLVRVEHDYFFALLAITIGIPGMIVALSARTRN